MSKADGDSTHSALAQQLAMANSSIIQHTGNSGNPHAVTAGQVGAYTTKQVDSAINGSINELESKLNVKISAVQTIADSNAANIKTAQDDIGSLKNDSKRNEQAATALQENYNSLNDIVSTVQEEITTLKSSATSLSNRLTSLEAAVAQANA